MSIDGTAAQTPDDFTKWFHIDVEKQGEPCSISKAKSHGAEQLSSSTNVCDMPSGRSRTNLTLIHPVPEQIDVPEYHVWYYWKPWRNQKGSAGMHTPPPLGGKERMEVTQGVGESHAHRYKTTGFSQKNNVLAVIHVCSAVHLPWNNTPD